MNGSGQSMKAATMAYTTKANEISVAAARKTAHARIHHETTRAGSSRKSRRSIAASVALLFALVGLAEAQTGQVIPSPKFVAYDNSGNPCNGCKLFSYVAGTTTKQDTYTSSALSVANANPVVMDSAGRATIFVDPTKSYKFVLAPSTDTDPPAAALWTVDNVVGPTSGVLTVTAANTRGVQIVRSGADAGLSIQSSGGSGKTYGLVSNTSGGFRIRDDSDGTPQIELFGNDITATLTGNFTVSGGLFVQSGNAGAHGLSGSTNGANTLGIRNTSTGAAAVSSVLVGNNAATNTAELSAYGGSFTTSGRKVADGALLDATGAGGLSLSATNAAGVMRFYTGSTPTERMRITAAGGVGIGVTSPTHDLHVKSTADDLTGGAKIERADNSYLILNMNDGGSGNAWGIIQAGDSGAYRETRVSPSGGGLSVGGGTAFLSVITNTASWDLPSMINGSYQSTTVTMTGVQASSPCMVGFWPNTGGTSLPGFLLSVSYDAANTVRVVAFNQTGSTADPSSATLRVTCFTY